VAQGTVNDVGVAQTKILEETLAIAGFQFARDDRRRLWDALPLLVVIRTICPVFLQHKRGVLVRSNALHYKKHMVPTRSQWHQ
jgi:hypothetical protein